MAGEVLFWDAAPLAQLVRTWHAVSPGMGRLAMPEQQLMCLAPELPVALPDARAGHWSHGGAEKGPLCLWVCPCLAGEL